MRLQEFFVRPVALFVVALIRQMALAREYELFVCCCDVLCQVEVSRRWTRIWC